MRRAKHKLTFHGDPKLQNQWVTITEYYLFNGTCPGLQSSKKIGGFILA